MTIVERLRGSRRFKRVHRFVERFERFIMPGALLFGVAFDFVTFRTLRIESAIALLIVHLTVALTLMISIHVSDEYLFDRKARALAYARMVAPFVLQISLGALLGASFIFYWFSGALSVSWPILGIVAVLMVSNETFRHAFQDPRVQWSVYTFALISMGTLILPFWTGRIGWETYALSNVLALTTVAVILAFLYRFVGHMRHRIASTIIGVVLVAVVMGVLYVGNVIPPIPLSVREAGVYHELYRDRGNYVVLSERTVFVGRFLPGQRVHVTPGERLYVFSAVFAPTDLRTRIVHEWQRYDEREHAWVTQSRSSFAVTGGRQNGYRGYSYSDRVTPGRWRVNVQTEEGSTLGRLRFRVLPASGDTEFVELIK